MISHFSIKRNCFPKYLQAKIFPLAFTFYPTKSRRLKLNLQQKRGVLQWIALVHPSVHGFLLPRPGMRLTLRPSGK